VNHFLGDSAKADGMRYVLRSTERHTVVINYYEPAGNDDQSRMQELISDAINFYIDRAVLVTGDKLSLIKPSDLMHRELGQIVRDAVQYYNYKEIADFKGFSSDIKRKLQSIDGMSLNSPDWSPELKGNKLADARFFLVQNILNDLRADLKDEIGIFTDSNLMVQIGSSETELAKHQDRLLNEVRNMKKDDLLAPIEIEFSNATLNLLASEDEFVLPTCTQKTPDDFADKILAMLEQNSAKIDAIRNEVEEIKRQPVSYDPSFQSQIDELKGMLNELINGNRPASGAYVSNLPDGFDVRFNTGSTALSIDAKMQLNELVEIMAVNPQMRIILTGFADTSGSRDLNLKLSKDRANAVRKYLISSGIEQFRILINYFGEERAAGANAAERRVEVEFLPS
jgi:outer membrane protein OmpA-like peptidoglycan-associated protein